MFCKFGILNFRIRIKNTFENAASGSRFVVYEKKIRIRNRIRILRIRIFLGLSDPNPDPLVRGTDPDPSLFP
jgi:hypothetical protein